MKRLFISLVIGVLHLVFLITNCYGEMTSEVQVCIRIAHADNSGVVWYMGDLIKNSGLIEDDIGTLRIGRLLGIAGFSVSEQDLKNMCTSKTTIISAYTVVMTVDSRSVERYHGHLDKAWVDINIP